jgi:hypothetical protein
VSREARQESSSEGWRKQSERRGEGAQHATLIAMTIFFVSGCEVKKGLTFFVTHAKEANMSGLTLVKGCVFNAHASNFKDPKKKASLSLLALEIRTKCSKGIP